MLATLMAGDTAVFAEFFSEPKISDARFVDRSCAENHACIMGKKLSRGLSQKSMV